MNINIFQHIFNQSYFLESANAIYFRTGEYMIVRTGVILVREDDDAVTMTSNYMVVVYRNRPCAFVIRRK